MPFRNRGRVWFSRRVRIPADTTSSVGNGLSGFSGGMAWKTLSEIMVTLKMTERWKAVPGLEGMYEVSDRGRVRSLDRIVMAPQRHRGRLLRGTRAANGYRKACLSVPGRGEKHLFIHRLVLLAFRGQPLPKHQCRH